MTIGYLIPGTGLDEAERKRRTRILNELALNGARVSLLEVDDGPPSIESPDDERTAVPHLVRLVERSRGAVDGFVIGCYSDLGITPVRQAARVPVVGPVRASFATAAAGFGTFSILTINREVIPILEEQVRCLGFVEHVDDIGAVEIGVLEIIRDPDGALARFESALTRMDTDAIVPGCMSYAFLLAERGIGELAGVRIVNPLSAALHTVQSLLS